MQHRCTRAAGEEATAVEGMVAQLRELLLPPPPTPGGDGMSWPSGPVAELFDNTDERSPTAMPGPRGACSHAPVMAEEPVCAGRRRRRGSKRARDEQHGELVAGGGANAKPRCGRKTSRRNKGSETTMLVTTVPDFDGYQWRKYGQKQIEGAKYPRSYYRCTNSTDQRCPAKRTVQRNHDDVDVDGAGGPPRYTVVYVEEHTCKTTEAVAPVILETTVRTKEPEPADDNAAAHVVPLLTPDVVVVPAAGSSTATGSSCTATAGTESPAISSGIAWSSDANLSDNDCYPQVDGLFAVDHWAAAAATLLQETDFAGPIRSPVHITADGWIDDLLWDTYG